MDKKWNMGSGMVGRIVLPTILLLLSGSSLLQAQEVPTAELTRLLEADPRSLLNSTGIDQTYYASTALADGTLRPEREASAYVQVITSRQIKAYGVHTLMDALDLIPGFSAVLADEQQAGMGIRGNLATGGRCLFLLNGTPLNETTSGSFDVTTSILMDNVERIEVLIGPTTILHGDNAAMAVVNIVARNADSGAGGRVVGRSGFSDGQQSFTTVGLAGVHRISSDQEFNYMASLSKGDRSTADYTLPDGRPLALGDSTGYAANFFHLGYRWKNIRANATFLEDRRDVVGAPYTVQNRDLMISLEQRLELHKRLGMEWYAGYTDQTPWNRINTDQAAALAPNMDNERITARLVLRYQPWKGITFQLGGLGYQQTSTYQWRGDQHLDHFNGKPSITFNSLAWYLQGSWRSKAGILTAGLRQEHHGLVGTLFSHRVAFTRVVGRFHGKLMVGQAHHFPSLLNLDNAFQAKSLLPERIVNWEAEAGFRIKHSLRLTINLHQSTIHAPITRAIDGPYSGYFVNRASVGTRGADARVQVEKRKLSILAGAGVYSMLPSSDLDEALLGLPGEQEIQGKPGLKIFAALGYEQTPWLAWHFRGTRQCSKWSMQMLGEGDIGLVEWGEELNIYLGTSIRPGMERRLQIELG